MRRVGVLGLARSGVAAAELALRRGLGVYASDNSDGVQQREAAEAIRARGGEADTGTHDVNQLARCDALVLSPGIPPSAPILHHPALRGIPVVPEIDFAFDFLGVPVIAITGTNGKTTTTALISHVLSTAGIDAPAGGNIGRALSELALLEPRPEWAVVEVSSFQLGAARRFAPAIGILTNLAPDHLDWYPDLGSYFADKQRLFQNALPTSRWILNAEDGEVLNLARDVEGVRYTFRVSSLPERGEQGGYVDADGWIVLRTDGVDERVLPFSALRLLGRHNVANCLAAAVAARLAGAGIHDIARGLASFEAPPHRLQVVAERNGVVWINDSKATNVASTSVALRSMERPTILLLGGRHKGEPYTTLISDAGSKVRKVIAFGEAADIVISDLEGAIPVERVIGPFEAVVRRAAEMASPGDAVLLSPACSSFDMFTNYEERGDRFAALVREMER